MRGDEATIDKQITPFMIDDIGGSAAQLLLEGKMKENMVLIGVYSMKTHTPQELERIFKERFAGKVYESVCDTEKGIVRVFEERNHE